MTDLIRIFAISLGCCLICTPLARELAKRFRLLDEPDGGRKKQVHGIPWTGGLAVLISTILSLTVTALWIPYSRLFSGHAAVMVGLGCGCVINAALGVFDDWKSLGVHYKLPGQIVAVGMVIAGGVSVRTVHLFGCSWDLGFLSVPFTIFFLLGAINAFNLIDGMDGLLGSMGVILSLAMAAMAAAAGHGAAAGVAMALAGALLGFLRYNLSPATIYLGACGSMVVGLILGTLAILCSLKAPATIALTAPLALLTIPIFDTVVAIVRRKLTGRSLYSTDRGHLHHCLLQRGLTVPSVLLIIIGLCLLTDLGVLASQAFNQEWIALCTAAAVIAILVLTRLFGHAEIQLLKQRLRSLVNLLFVSDLLAQTHQIEVQLQGTGVWKEMWADLTSAAEEMNLTRLLLDVNAPALGEGYHARWRCYKKECDASVWRADIPIRANGQVVGRLEISGIQDLEPFWLKIGLVSELVERFGQTRNNTNAESVRLLATWARNANNISLRHWVAQRIRVITN